VKKLARQVSLSRAEVRFRAEQCMTTCVFEDKGFRYWFEDRFRELASHMAGVPNVLRH